MRKVCTGEVFLSFSHADRLSYDFFCLLSIIIRLESDLDGIDGQAQIHLMASLTRILARASRHATSARLVGAYFIQPISYVVPDDLFRCQNLLAYAHQSFWNIALTGLTCLRASSFHGPRVLRRAVLICGVVLSRRSCLAQGCLVELRAPLVMFSSCREEAQGIIQPVAGGVWGSKTAASAKP